jgi:hypothetical protein
MRRSWVRFPPSAPAFVKMTTISFLNHRSDANHETEFGCSFVKWVLSFAELAAWREFVACTKRSNRTDFGGFCLRNWSYGGVFEAKSLLFCAFSTQLGALRRKSVPVALSLCFSDGESYSETKKARTVATGKLGLSVFPQIRS